MIQVRIVVRLCKQFGGNAKSRTTYTQAWLLCFVATECLYYSVNQFRKRHKCSTKIVWLASQV